MLEKALESADKAMEQLDKATLSAQEVEEARTKRHELDTTSPFKLPHLIRPIIALTLLFLEVIVVVVYLAFQVTLPEHLSYGLDALLISAIGFYFNARKAEKITAKKAAASIEIEKRKEKQALTMERKEMRQALREQRREARRNKQ